MTAEEEAYHELCAYTLTHDDPAFIHQHVVDAYMAQHANEETKPIGITFALVGLYLHLERGFSGRHVQRAHMTLGKEKRPWPRFPLPANRGSMTAADVLAKPAGVERDRAIDAWCESVWAAYRAESRQTIIDLLRQYGIT
jgi:hypothetical protein